MRKSFIIFITYLLFSCFLIHKSHSEEFPKELKPPPDSAVNQGTRRTISNSPLDGVTLLTGIYYPLQGEVKDIYGGAFAIGGQYCFNMSRSIDLLGAVSLIKSDGDPYYDDPTFSSDRLSNIQLVPFELSIRQRIAFMKSLQGFVTRGLYFGGGINYIRAREKVADMFTTNGGDFGIHLFVGPQVFFTNNLAFDGEIKLIMNGVDMRDSNNEYSMNLSGLVIRAGLSWYY
ncbi:hypothetical protein GF312_08570 [Candidatus Poribacteria bacterium]|nr:hypothetical protein [Candidatus Poribacteria bacterium]